MATAKTPAPDPNAAVAVNPDDLKPAAHGQKDPVGKETKIDKPVETIEAQGIGPRDPYPTGSPPAQEEGKPTGSTAGDQTVPGSE